MSKTETTTTQIKFDTQTLLSKLSKCIKFVPSKSTLPIYMSFKVDVAGDKAIFYASNGEVQISLSVEYTGVKGFRGQFCIPASKLVSTLQLCRESETIFTIKFSTDKKGNRMCKAVVQNGEKTKCTFQCDLPEHFTEKEIPQTKNEATISGNSFKQSIEVCKRFVAPEKAPTREAFKGVLITEKDNNLIFSSTNGNSFAYLSVRPKSIISISSAVIPVKTFILCSNLIMDRDIIDILFDDRAVVVRNEEFTVISSIIVDTYPDVSKLMMKVQEGYYSFDFNTLELCDAINRIGIYICDNFQGLNFLYTPDDLASYAFLKNQGEEYGNIHDASEMVETPRQNIQADIWVQGAAAVNVVESINGFADKMNLLYHSSGAPLFALAENIDAGITMCFCMGSMQLVQDREVKKEAKKEETADL